MARRRMSLIDAFVASTNHAQLGQRVVAREVVLALRDHSRLTPPTLCRMAHALRMPGAAIIETGEIIARWLMADGWVVTAVRPFVGKGMGAVSAYEPTEKWRKLASMFG